MRLTRFLALATLSLTLAARPAAAADAAPARPNIVIIMADDMGYSDLGCYGSEIRTPNLDRLAAGGLRFTQFYNNARCCPTRASLLTGVYPHQAGVGHMVDDKDLPGFRGDLGQNVSTFAEALRPGGYGTYMAGKWHVTPAPGEKGAKADQHNWPRQRGFDRLYGTIRGAGNYFDPASLVRDDTLIKAATDAAYKPEKDYYYTDALSDHAVRFIAEHDTARKADPFVLYLAYTAAHWPLHAPESEVAKYKGKYDAGYEAIRDARLAKQRELGLIDPAWKPAPLAKRWADVKDKVWEARCMEVYAAQVDVMDNGIGRVVDALRATGRLENTLILFLQDNGGCAENRGRSAGADGKSPPLPGPADTDISYGQGWASVSNTPFREYKHWTHEGGISTPLIAHWPAAIARKGEYEKQPAHLIDIMATCLDVAGATAPKDRAGTATLPLEGKSLRPAFAGQPIARVEPIFFEHEGNRAVRDGDWKLVAKGPAGAWELYDIKADRGEQADLASAHPDRVKELSAKWEAWAKRTNATPWPWKKGEGTDENAGAGAAGPFTFKAGDTVEGAAAPAVGGKALRIVATIAKPGRNGVIIAQGGTAEGFSLYLKDGRPAFATRHGGTQTVVAATDELPADANELSVTLDAAGAVTIAAGGKQLATGKVPGPLRRKPTAGLSIGRGAGRAAVGPYEGQYPFDGAVGEVKLELTVKSSAE